MDCPHCGDTRVVDSGGFTPWMAPINVPCHYCNGDKVIHANLGVCFVTEACIYLQQTNPDPTSIFVNHDGETIEVSRSMLTWTS